MAHKFTEKPIDRAQSSIAALRAIESLIGQIGQLENNGSDLSILFSIIIENLDGAVGDIAKQLHQAKTSALNGGAA